MYAVLTQPKPQVTFLDASSFVVFVVDAVDDVVTMASKQIYAKVQSESGFNHMAKGRYVHFVNNFPSLVKRVICFVCIVSYLLASTLLQI